MARTVEKIASVIHTVGTSLRVVNAVKCVESSANATKVEDSAIHNFARPAGAQRLVEIKNFRDFTKKSQLSFQLIVALVQL